MVAHLPPELLAPEDRAARIAELERLIAGEWRRFAITEAIVIFLPFAVFLGLYVAGVVPDGALYPGVVAAVAAMVGLITYWLVRRILPLQRELTQVRELQASD